MEMSINEVNNIIFKIKTIVTFATGIPTCILILIQLFWVLNTCLFLNFTRKRLKRLKENCTDEYTRKLKDNAKFNFNKFIMVTILIIIEICAIVVPVINHAVFDKHFNSKEETVCFKDCCLKNWTFAYEIERLGHLKYVSCLLDSIVYFSIYCVFCLFATIMEYCQIGYMDKERDKQRTVRIIKCKAMIFFPVGVLMLILMAIPQTIIFGSLMYGIVSFIFIPLSIIAYKRLKRMRRSHLVDLTYECYNSPALIKNEIRAQKCAEIGANVIITGMVMLVLCNGFDMIVIRFLSSIILNPCWIKVMYSIDVNSNTEIPNSYTKILGLLGHTNHLMRSVIILSLGFILVSTHVAVITYKIRKMQKERREKKNDLIKELINNTYADRY